MLSWGMPLDDHLPDDPAELKRLLAERDKALTERDAKIAALTDTIGKKEAAWQRLKAALVWFQQRMFGRSSEKIPPEVLEAILESCAEVFGEDGLGHPGDAEGPMSGEHEPALEEEGSSHDEADEGEATAPPLPEEEEYRLVSGYRRRRGGGRKDQARGLPRVVIPHDLAGEDRRCPCCGDPMEKVGEVETKLVDFLAPLFYSLVHARSKYVCKKEECQDEVAPVTAPVPVTPLYKSTPGPGLLAHLLVSKYADHLPLTRQRKIYKRSGIDFAVSTLVRWVGKAEEFLDPLYELLKEQVLASDIVQTDDTKVTVLAPAPPGAAKPPGERPPPKKARVWVYRGDEAHPYVVFDATENWKKEGPAEFLRGYRGTLQADGYGGYDHLFEDEEVREAGCWSHARRYFTKAKAVDKALSARALRFIQKLFAVEKRAKREKLTPEARQARRQEESAPVLAELEAWLDEVEPRVLPKGPMAAAIQYTRNQWTALQLFLEDGRIELDNNASERDLRQVVVGRNNWKFFGSDAGARRAAVVYSVIASAVRCGVDPLAYLRNIFSELPGLPRDGPISRDLLESFLPDRWAADAKVQDSLLAHVGPEILRSLSASFEDLAAKR